MQVEAIEALAHTHQLPERQAAMTKVKKQWPALAALVDFGWQGVRQALERAALSPSGRSGRKRPCCHGGMGNIT
jgi:hypothetical protein